jgi:hypothetical protein
MKLSFFPRFSCSTFAGLKLDRPNLMMMSGDFQRGYLLTFGSASLLKAELSTALNAD